MASLFRFLSRPATPVKAEPPALKVDAKPRTPLQAMAGDAAVFYDFEDPRFLDFVRGGGGALTEAGVTITPEKALKNTTVFRCVSLISFAIGMLPLHLRNKATKAKAEDHAAFRVLHRKPNAWQTAFEFRSLMQQRALIHGNAYARILRRGHRVLQLVPFDPARTKVEQLPDWSLRYRYQRPEGGETVLPAKDVFHLRFGLSENGIEGISLVAKAAEAIGLAIQTETAAARLFRNGVIAGGILSMKKRLSPEAYDRLKASLEDRRGAGNAHRDMILEEDMDYKDGAQSGRDNQHLETRKHQIEDVARPFGVPRPLLAVDDTSWGSGVDVLGQMFVRYGLNPWFTAWEQAIERDILTDAETETIEAKFNAGGLLRGSMTDQAEFFAKALGSGGHQPWMTPEEIRALSDLTPGVDLPMAPGKQREADHEPS